MGLQKDNVQYYKDYIARLEGSWDTVFKLLHETQPLPLPTPIYIRTQDHVTDAMRDASNNVVRFSLGTTSYVVSNQEITQVVNNLELRMRVLPGTIFVSDSSFSEATVVSMSIQGRLISSSSKVLLEISPKKSYATYFKSGGIIRVDVFRIFRQTNSYPETLG